MELPSTPIISADGHVNEGPDFWKRIPEPFRSRALPSDKVEGDRIESELFGMRIAFPRKSFQPTDADGLSARELACEWRRDPTDGIDLPVRLGLQARDGVCAEVVFPNLLLALGYQPDADLNLAVSRTYNDWVHEIFAPMPERYAVVGMVPVDDLDLAVEEAERLAARGFRSIMLHTLEFTGTDCLLWGNDYPHDEGTYPESASFIAEIRKHTTPDQAEAILAGNAARLYGFDLEKLAGGARALQPAGDAGIA